jgi:hypothetical protein
MTLADVRSLGVRARSYRSGQATPLVALHRFAGAPAGYSAPDFFLADTPTAALARQVARRCRAIREGVTRLERASLVAKLKPACDRKIAQGVKCSGRKSYMERDPALVAAANALSAQRPRLSLRRLRDVEW